MPIYNNRKINKSHAIWNVKTKLKLINVKQLLCSLLLTISTRGRESLQFILQSLAQVLLRFLVLSSLVLFGLVFLSRVFALFWLLCQTATTAEIQLWRSFYTNGCNIRCARVRKGGLKLAKPIRFQIVGFWTFVPALFLCCLRRCRTVLVNYMLGQYDLKNVQNLTYFVYFFSKTKHLHICELNLNIWLLLSYNFTILHFCDVTLLLPDRAKYLSNGWRESLKPVHV